MLCATAVAVAAADAVVTAVPVAGADAAVVAAPVAGAAAAVTAVPVVGAAAAVTAVAAFTTSIMPVSTRSLQRKADPAAAAATNFGAKRTARRKARRFPTGKADGASENAKISEK